jgi:Uma2 family endonuclease
MSKATYKFSVNDYHRIIDTGLLDRKRVELIEGEILEMSPEKPFHAGVNGRLSFYLGLKFQDIACVRSGLPITLSTSEPEPDLAICKIDLCEYLKHHPVPSDIYAVVELSNSTLKFDLDRKKQIYAVDGIGEYWVVDLNQREINRFTLPVKGEYTKVEKIFTGDVSFLQFPNIIIEVEKFFP